MTRSKTRADRAQGKAQRKKELQKVVERRKTMSWRLTLPLEQGDQEKGARIRDGEAGH